MKKISLFIAFLFAAGALCSVQARVARVIVITVDPPTTVPVTSH